MNRRQKIVQAQFLNDEEKVIKRLKQVYGQSLKDIEKKAKALQDDIEELDKLAKLAISDDEKEVILSKKRSKVYQKQYQDSLKKQVGGILDTMHDKEFKVVSEYLNKCYEEGFIGTLYDLQGQGIPLCFPLDQEAMVRAIQLDSKISKGLYTRLGEDVTTLKKKITAQVSRGISTGMTFPQIAKQLAGYTNIGYNNAIRIARTEGHRIQCQSGMDACHKAKDRGANVVKQWDSTLDGATRESHVAVDGQIRELDKPFSNGLMFPGDPSGAAAEVINCRCALLQRARWALEDSFTKMNNFTKQLETFESPEEYGEFKKAFFSKENRRYMDYVEALEQKYRTKDFNKILAKMTEREYKHYSKLLSNNPLLTKSSKTDIIPSKKFTPATTIAEAEAYARSIGLECSYKGIDLTVANEMNAAFARGIEYCPEVREHLRMVGSAQERNKLFRAAMTEYYDEYFRTNYPGRPESWYKKYAEQYARKSVGNVPGNTYAFAQRRGTGGASKVVADYEGIFVNSKFGKKATDFLESIKNDAKTGWHPKGCDTIASVFDHEMAHQIDYAVGLRTNPEMVSLWRSMTKKEVEEGLSRYGATKIEEFIAEGYAEFLCSPNPRPVATKIGQIIERAVKNSG